jgi:hypothetical protein
VEELVTHTSVLPETCRSSWIDANAPMVEEALMNAIITDADDEQARPPVRDGSRRGNRSWGLTH